MLLFHFHGSHSFLSLNSWVLSSALRFVWGGKRVCVCVCVCADSDVILRVRLRWYGIVRLFVCACSCIFARVCTRGFLWLVYVNGSFIDFVVFCVAFSVCASNPHFSMFMCPTLRFLYCVCVRARLKCNVWSKEATLWLSSFTEAHTHTHTHTYK